MIKSIKGYQGLYTISDKGEVNSLDRYNVDKNGKALRCQPCSRRYNTEIRNNNE